MDDRDEKSFWDKDHQSVTDPFIRKLRCGQLKNMFMPAIYDLAVGAGVENDVNAWASETGVHLEIGCWPECVFDIPYEKIGNEKFVMGGWSQFQTRALFRLSIALSGASPVGTAH